MLELPVKKSRFKRHLERVIQDLEEKDEAKEDEQEEDFDAVENGSFVESDERSSQDEEENDG